jgi:hypothetical protein
MYCSYLFVSPFFSKKCYQLAVTVVETRCAIEPFTTPLENVVASVLQDKAIVALLTLNVFQEMVSGPAQEKIWQRSLHV